MIRTTAVVRANSIPDFEDVVPVSATDDPCFRELFTVLRKHNALNRFGICLLHEHFALAEDEALVEFVDQPNRTMTLKPVKANVMTGNSLETAWRFTLEASADEIGVTTVPTRRCITNCVWEDGPNGRHHHNVHKWNDSPT